MSEPAAPVPPFEPTPTQTKRRGDYRVATSTSIWLLAIALGTQIVVTAGVVVASLTLRPSELPEADVFAWLIVAMSVLTPTLMLVVLRARGHRLADIGFRRPSWRLLHVLWQFPVMVVLALVAQIVFVSLVEIAPPEPFSVTSFADASGVAVLAALASLSILVPLYEEMTFRGVLLGLTQRRLGTGWAIVISALAFGVAHLVLGLLPYYVTIGVCLALIRLFHRNVWASVIAHAGLNTMATLVGLFGF